MRFCSSSLVKRERVVPEIVSLPFIAVRKLFKDGKIRRRKFFQAEPAAVAHANDLIA
jgi:hypothetical protein